MSVIGNSPGVASQRVVSPFTATSGQTTFTPISGYTLGYCDVFLNGIKLANGDDYTASDGTTVVLAVGAALGDFVEIVAYFPRGLSDGYLKAEADARYPRVDTASQGLNSTQQGNARTNINAQAALGYTPVNKAGDTITGTLTFNNGNNPAIPVSHVRYGYSNSYGALKLGTAGAAGQTISLYADPSSNSSGAFNGNGVELLSIHNLSFTTPNPANTTFYNPLRFDSGNAWRPRVTAFHGTGASPVTDTGSKWLLNVNGKFATVRTNQNSAWDNSTGIFSPPVEGFYYFYFSALMDSSANGAGPVHRIAIRQNTTEVCLGYSNNAPSGYYHGMLACSCVIYCYTTDQITFRATSGNIHTGTETHWGGYLL